MSPPLAKRYLYGTPKQHATLVHESIETIDDLLERVATRDPRSLVPHTIATPGARKAVLKKHLLFYLLKRCGGLFLDVERGVHDRVLKAGGVYPNQWIGVCDTGLAKGRPPRGLPLLVPPPPRPFVGVATSHADLCRDFNAGILDDDEALWRGIAASRLEDAKTQSSSPAVVDRAIRRAWNDGDDDVELCCPITCERFRDPVQTIHGQTYERRAILDWFSTHKTDPLTGLVLPTTHVWPDVEMKARCA
jgi:hypothetical protein